MFNLEGYRTIIAATVALAGAVLKQFGVELDEAGIVTAVMSIGGAAGAIYYRFQAKVPVKD